MCVREVSLAQVSCILMYVYVAPPTPVGAWSMALGLRQRFEYYDYDDYDYDDYIMCIYRAVDHATQSLQIRLQGHWRCRELEYIMNTSGWGK